MRGMLLIISHNPPTIVTSAASTHPEVAAAQPLVNVPASGSAQPLSSTISTSHSDSALLRTGSTAHRPQVALFTDVRLATHLNQVFTEKHAQEQRAQEEKTSGKIGFTELVLIWPFEFLHCYLTYLVFFSFYLRVY